MQLKEFLLTQFDREAMAAQKVVERGPEGRNGWHEVKQYFPSATAADSHLLRRCNRKLP